MEEGKDMKEEEKKMDVNDEQKIEGKRRWKKMRGETETDLSWRA